MNHIIKTLNERILELRECEPNEELGPSGSTYSYQISNRVKLWANESPVSVDPKQLIKSDADMRQVYLRLTYTLVNREMPIVMPNNIVMFPIEEYSLTSLIPYINGMHSEEMMVGIIAEFVTHAIESYQEISDENYVS